MAKYSEDAGLKYLKEIGFERIKNPHGLAERFVKLFGRQRADQIWETWESLSAASLDFYEFKNSDPQISKAITEAYDGDILRKACNYVDSHRSCFGETILEVGCESGYMTGFLARTFSDARIVSIDRSQAALNLAKKRAESMGITNVEFRVASIDNIEEKFDTVFCMRTINENISDEKRPFDGEALLNQFVGYKELTREYTHKLLSCLKDDGCLCIFERNVHDALICGWMMELCQANCSPDIETYQELYCEEAGEKNAFNAFVCHNQREEDPQEVIDLWYETKKFDDGKNDMKTDLNALAFLAKHAGRFVRGIRIINKENRQCGRFLICFDRESDAVIHFFYAAGGDGIRLYTLPADQKDDVISLMESFIPNNVKIGNRVEEIDPSNGFTECVTDL